MNGIAMRVILAAIVFLAGNNIRADAAKKLFRPMDVFGLQYASDPRISPDAKRLAYVRHFMDIMKDRQRSNVWTVNLDGTDPQAVTTGNFKDTSPHWSADGKRLLFISDRDGTPQLYCQWLNTGRTARLTNLTSPPLQPAWSPDGKHIAFVMFVPEPEKPFVKMPAPPKGAEWAPAAKLIRKLHYRFDGKGYLPNGHRHLFVISAEGGPARQVTSGPYDHGGTMWAVEGPVWTPDGKGLIFAANRRPEAEHDPLNSEIYEVSVAGGTIKALTDRAGPDHLPAISPDGQHIAYVGFDDRRQGHQLTRLYLMNRDGDDRKALTAKLDRSVDKPRWNTEGTGIYFMYDDLGDTKVGLVHLDGEMKTITGGVGALVLDRPYASGNYDVGKDGLVAFTRGRPDRPADIARTMGGTAWNVTSINENLLSDRSLGAVEEIWYDSSHDGRKIQGWIVKPPGFDPNKKYPLILEIHGGPFANYGPWFAADMQLYAAAGYVVFYANPRGSTGYGQEFANLIHHAYPGFDYDDLMSGVDAVLKRGYVDTDNLFVTGGSGGGVLTAWIIGKTRRFRAAVVGKPVINWHSFVLTADAAAFFPRYWFPGPPWEHPEHYRKRSPLSLVGNVTTPTMLITGEEDQRTPISESEQYYQALKLRKVDAALVRVPGASHDIAARPSHLIAKAAYVLRWFEMHRKK